MFLCAFKNVIFCIYYKKNEMIVLQDIGDYWASGCFSYSMKQWLKSFSENEYS